MELAVEGLAVDAEDSRRLGLVARDGVEHMQHVAAHHVLEGLELARVVAVHDHLAFNYFPAAGVLTIPVQYWGGSPDMHFSGFASFGVSTQDGLTDLGRMDHGDLARATYCPDPATGRLTIACDEGYYLESATPRRAVGGIINGERYVFTVSDVAIKAARVERRGMRAVVANA